MESEGSDHMDAQIWQELWPQSDAWLWEDTAGSPEVYPRTELKSLFCLKRRASGAKAWTILKLCSPGLKTSSGQEQIHILCSNWNTWSMKAIRKSEWWHLISLCWYRVCLNVNPVKPTVSSGMRARHFKVSKLLTWRKYLKKILLFTIYYMIPVIWLIIYIILASKIHFSMITCSPLGRGTHGFLRQELYRLLSCKYKNTFYSISNILRWIDATSVYLIIEVNIWVSNMIHQAFKFSHHHCNSLHYMICPSQ